MGMVTPRICMIDPTFPDHMTWLQEHSASHLDIMSPTGMGMDKDMGMGLCIKDQWRTGSMEMVMGKKARRRDPRNYPSRRRMGTRMGTVTRMQVLPPAQGDSLHPSNRSQSQDLQIRSLPQSSLGRRSRSVPSYATPKQSLTVQKACSNCRRAKLKCIVNDGETDCVRCKSRIERCVFFPRTHVSSLALCQTDPS